MVVKVADPPLDTPEIQIGTDLERMTDEAVKALAKDPRTYQRGGMLVGVVTIPDVPTAPRKDIRRAIGAPVIRPVAAPTIRERLSASAKWLKYDGRNKKYNPCLPPEAVVSAVAARGEWGGVRTLVSVATSPSLKPDGTVLQAPGYDADTATLYWPRESYAEVPDRPSLDDARGAIDAIREVVCDFPFARPEHESAWIAGLLTMLSRPAIAGPCPMFAVDATTRGTGKSRLVDAAVRIANGSDAARTSMPDDDDEMRKRITALMLEGDPAVCLDNIARVIALPSLDNVLTATIWKDRMLGVTGNISAPARAVWWATGNNLSLGGDLSRRTLHIRMESALENPEERTEFKHAQLLTWINAERKRLVASALTILRAFVVAGRPKQGTPVWGSFEDWSALIPPAIVWCGMADPMLARGSRAADAEPERDAIRAFLHGFRGYLEAQGRNSISARELLGHIYSDDASPDLREAADTMIHVAAGKQPTTVQLTGALRRNRGRVIDHMRIATAETDGHTRLTRWTVDSLGSVADPAPAPAALDRVDPSAPHGDVPLSVDEVR